MQGFNEFLRSLSQKEGSALYDLMGTIGQVCLLLVV